MIEHLQLLGLSVLYARFLLSGFMFDGTNGPAHYFAGLYNDANQALTVPEFNEKGQIETSRDALGNITQYIYDEEARTETKINPLGGQFVTQYDERGNVTSTTNEIGAVTSTTYDANDNALEINPPCGCKTKRTYDANGNVLTETDPQNAVTRYVYSSNNELTSLTDALGRTTKYAYNTDGHLTAVTDASGIQTLLEPDEIGRYSKVTDPLGRVTRFEHEDGPGGVQIAKPNRVLFADGTTQSFTYNAMGQAASHTDASGAIQQLISDDNGKLLKRVDPLGHETSYGYDSNAQLTSVTNALGQVTRMEYDAEFRLTKRTDPNGGVMRFGYDALGRMTNKVDEVGRETKMQYRADGVVTNIVQPDGTSIAFEYDTSKRRTAVIDPRGNRTEFVYDGNSRVIERKDALNKSSYFFYNAVGNQTETIDRNGRSRRFDYDERDNAVRETWIENNAVAKVIDMTYDSLGNVLTAGDEASTHEFAYDNRNRIQTATARHGATTPFVLNYDYDEVTRSYKVTDNTSVSVGSKLDARGLVEQIIWQGGPVSAARVNMTYNELGDMTGVQRLRGLVGNNHVVNTDYDFGRARKDIGFSPSAYYAQGDESMVQSFEQTEAYGPLGVSAEGSDLLVSGSETLRRITGVSHVNGAGGNLLNSQYQYSPAGQLTNEVTSVETAASTVKSFEHDATGQLTSVLSVPPLANETFEYDTAGNRTNDVVRSYVVASGNRIQSDSSFTYSHDDEGNLIAKTSPAERWQYTYDHRNRMVEATKFITPSLNPVITVLYTYDPLDRRIAKKVTTPSTPERETRYHYDSDAMWMEENIVSGVTTTTHYLTGQGIDQWLARNRGTNSKDWYLSDRLGSITGIADDNGALLNRTDYESFGKIKSQSDPSQADGIGFTGREYDSETGLYYYRARYYDPSLGKFLRDDPIEFAAGDFNVRRYVGNDPLGFVDPLGLQTSKENTFLTSRIGIALKDCAAKLGVEVVGGNLMDAGLYFFFDIKLQAPYVGMGSNTIQERVYDHKSAKRLVNEALDVWKFGSTGFSVSLGG